MSLTAPFFSDCDWNPFLIYFCTANLNTRRPPLSSALALVSAFVATRWATRSLPALFSEAIAYIRLDTVRAAQRRTTELELGTNAPVIHAMQ